jgi:hypothetical protein
MTIAKLSIVILPLRLLHGILYVLNMHPIRDAIWWASFFAVASMFVTILHPDLFAMYPEQLFYYCVARFLDVLFP